MVKNKYKDEIDKLNRKIKLYRDYLFLSSTGFKESGKTEALEVNIANMGVFGALFYPEQLTEEQRKQIVPILKGIKNIYDLILEIDENEKRNFGVHE